MTHTLLCRLDNAGDVLLTGPATRAVAAHSEKVTYLSGPKGREAAMMLPGVDDVITHRAAWIDPDGAPADRRSVESLVDQVGSIGATHAVVFTSFHQSPLPTALILRMAGIPVITAISDDYPGSLLDVRHRIDPDIHEVERNLSLVATLGYRLPPGDDGRLHVAYPPQLPPEVPEPPFVVVHPGANAPARTARPDLFAGVVDVLVTEGWRVVVTGSPNEVGLTGSITGGRHGVTDLGGRTDLAGLAAVLGTASALVCGNTGPAHLAAAVGVPVVEIYPPTVPASRWRPWAVPHALIGDQQISCAGCRATHCPLPAQLCISSARPEDVVAAMRCVISDRDYLFPSYAVGTVVA